MWYCNYKLYHISNNLKVVEELLRIRDAYLGGRTNAINLKENFLERSHNLDRSFRNSYIIPSFPTREQHARSVQNARSRFNKLNQSYSC